MGGLPLLADLPHAESAVAETRTRAEAEELVRWCLTQLAYYKAPGYVSYVDELPTTATNKVQRSSLKDLVAGLAENGRFVDTRALKKRPVSS